MHLTPPRPRKCVLKTALHRAELFTIDRDLERIGRHLHRQFSPAYLARTAGSRQLLDSYMAAHPGLLLLQLRFAEEEQVYARSPALGSEVREQDCAEGVLRRVLGSESVREQEQSHIAARAFSIVMEHLGTDPVMRPLKVREQFHE